MAARKLSWKPEVHRLQQSELTYEMVSRGFSASTVGEMRKSFRNILKLEADQSLSSVPNPISFATDTEAIVRLLTDLRSLYDSFDGDLNSFRRISALLLHTIRRIERSNAEEADQIVQKRKWLLEAENLRTDFDDKAKSLRDVTTVGNAVNQPQHTSSPFRTTLITSDSDESDVDASSHPIFQLSRSNYHTPVTKWGVTYDGESTTSLNSFLERIEELRVARNVTSEQLHASAIDLFSGNALLWFRSIRNDVHDWTELTSRLRRTFLPSDYDEKLQREIADRVQGTQERPVFFVAAMRNLFRRLTKVPSEAEQLKRIVKNLRPQYAQPLVFTPVNSHDELLSRLELLENSFSDSRRFDPKPRAEPVLEPDLAYKQRLPSKHLDKITTTLSPTTRVPLRQGAVGVASKQIATSSISVTCWNCGQKGHLSPSCPLPQKRHCYRCGEQNVTVRTCPKCKKTSENFSVSRRPE
jgi:hypothetical protein